jgi:AcrR family transcriptional regulator
MPHTVNRPRTYRSIRRAEQAAATRHAILSAARELFIGAGYARTTVGAIAAKANVSVDTIYASVGRKPQLMRAVLEAAISGSDDAVPALERDYVQRIRDTRGAREKLALYAEVIGQMSPRTAPVFAALRDAAGTDSDCAALLAEISGRRADNMERFAADVRAAGGVRDDLSDRRIADIIWATAGFEHYLQLAHGRGWSADEYTAYLAESWTRTLLA